ncbi:MAG: hypothetical protein K6G16_03360 [Lachnospiraceae bacterium]|nr:hypothetical protein [Lachnospiraceae bacterium]
MTKKEWTPEERRLRGRMRLFGMLAGILAALPSLILAVIVLAGRGAFLPSWVRFENRQTEKNGQVFTVSGKRFTVREGDRTVLATPGQWLVQDLLLSDIDGDGMDEVLLLVWKRGSFGAHRPTWIARDERRFSQHICIYEQRMDRREAGTDAALPEEIWHQCWMSSAMPLSCASWKVGDEIPGTGRPSVDLTDPDGNVMRFGWLSWGLTRLDG